MSNEQLAAFAAAMIMARGKMHVTDDASRKIRPAVHVYCGPEKQAAQELVDGFGGKIVDSYTDGKPMFVWKIRGIAAVDALEQVRPFLSGRRRNHADHILGIALERRGAAHA